MKVYEVEVYLYEGEPVSLGYFNSKEAAHKFANEEFASGEWDGPNVETLQVTAHEVKE